MMSPSMLCCYVEEKNLLVKSFRPKIRISGKNISYTPMPERLATPGWETVLVPAPGTAPLTQSGVAVVLVGLLRHN